MRQRIGKEVKQTDVLLAYPELKLRLKHSDYSFFSSGFPLIILQNLNCNHQKSRNMFE